MYKHKTSGEVAELSKSNSNFYIVSNMEAIPKRFVEESLDWGEGKVSPAYTSQTCSKCGYVDKNSRNSENFNCTYCKYEIDADYNASINILNKGAYSPFNQ